MKAKTCGKMCPDPKKWNTFERAMRKYSGTDTVRVYKEQGVYNMYVQVQNGA